jgi:D-alanine-D-alanine ligase
MKQARRKPVLAFAFGGKAAEHDLSVKSALHLLGHVDRDRFDVVSLYVGKDGRLAESPAAKAKMSELLSLGGDAVFAPDDDPPPDFAGWIASTVPPEGNGSALQLLSSGAVDVVFPVFHGQGGEDGIFQGFLETLGVPYVGCGISGSIVGNDKSVNKAILRNAGIRVTDFLVVGRKEWETREKELIQEAEEELGYPIFVKPPCLGSSVGISRAADRDALRKAVAEAHRYGPRALLEKSVSGTEYGIGLIGNGTPMQSAIVEFGGAGAFLSYEAKYGTEIFEDLIPAPLPPDTERELRENADRIYRMLDLRGMSRLDFFVADGLVYFNEANTVPGFGTVSVFSKMWGAAGVPLPDLIGKLAEFAIEHSARGE